VVGLGGLVPPQAHAQVLPGWDFAVAGFGGGAFPFETDFPLSNSVSFGGKIQAWTTAARATIGLDFGAEVDVTQYYPDSASTAAPASSCISIRGVGCRTGNGSGATATDVSATIAALNLLLRWPLGVSDTFPQGRWYPYLGIGGGAEIARATVQGSGATDTDTAPVLQVLGGATVFLTKHLSVFAEYKFTHAAHTFSFATSPVPTRQDNTYNVNYVVGGLAVHF
jgi:opacity protein-like surface antigen